MKINKLSEAVEHRPPITALLYCAPGVGKSTALGIIAEKSQGKTLILDVDRTFVNAMAKMEVVHDLSKVDIIQIDNIKTFDDWTNTLMEIDEMGGESLLSVGTTSTLSFVYAFIGDKEKAVKAALSAIETNGRLYGADTRSQA